MTIKVDEMEVRYRRAEVFLKGLMSSSLVENDTVFPTWIQGTDCFWYRRAYQNFEGSSKTSAYEYRLVNVRNKSNEEAFDHEILARALQDVSREKVSGHTLPIKDISIDLTPLSVFFTAFGKHWNFDGQLQECRSLDVPVVKQNEALSPNGIWIAFPREHNLWMREVSSGKEYPLTQDGESYYSYGLGSEIWGRASVPCIPGLWAPDSRHLLTVRRDMREVKSLPHVNHVPLDGSIRPQLESYKVAYAGDESVETFEIYCVDTVTGKVCKAQYHPSPSGYSGEICPFFERHTWWALDCRLAYFVDRDRGQKIVRLVEFDVKTGATKVLIEDTFDTYGNTCPDGMTYPLYTFLPETNEMIWWSERSGWGHLYLYDLELGIIKHSITSGDWFVRDVLHLDAERRELLIQTYGRTRGRDPYYADICCVDLDSGLLKPVVSTDHKYVVHHAGTVFAEMQKLSGGSRQINGVSSDGNYIVATRTRADLAPITILLDRSGNLVMEIERADISRLPDDWQWPEPVKLLAADGNTEIFGLVFRPSDFDEAKRYPLINLITSGPTMPAVPKGSFHTCREYADRHYFQSAALAELGFVVLNLDSRGTALRGKAFQDESYGWFNSAANTEDHATAIHQLGTRYPYIDLDRVGIYGNFYICSLQNFLERQDLYKVCVQAWVAIDSRMFCAPMAEACEGLDGPSKARLYPENLVKGLSGKLLLMNGMNSHITAMYPPACGFRIIDALHKANKDFDMLFVANTDFGPDNYMQRRSWDYLVSHLLGEKPPKEYKLGDLTWLGDVDDVLE